MGARLSEVLAASCLDAPIEVAGDLEAIEVTSVTCDTRRLEPGALFCCLTGGARDGHDFARDAVGSGAVALLCSRKLDVDVPQILVEEAHARSATAELAASFWGHPADRLTMVGVTGTNGKTTVTHLLAAIFGAHGWQSSPLGTLSGPMTTPDPPELHRLLAERLAAGDAAVAMEVSSHGLAGHRVDGICFDVAVFTNLGHDHLDFHGTQEEYFAAKAELFTPRHARSGVVGVDDQWGRRLAGMSAIPVHPYSIEDAAGLRMDETGSTFELDGEVMRVGMIGRFNVANAIGASRAASLLGIAGDEIVRGLQDFPGVPGRLERVSSNDTKPVVFVDFAHTPDGLAAACAAVGEILPTAKLVVVFGCGGDRDASKRPVMGRVAAENADVAIVTSDNPRSEEPGAIIEAVVGGVRPGSRAEVQIEPDREAAIARGILEAGTGGVLLIAGKGHESGQEIAGRNVPFDDREVSSRLLVSRGVHQ